MADPIVIDPNERIKESVNLLWSHPELGPQVRRALKEKFPDIQTPEDAAEPAIAPLRAQIEALQAQLKESAEASAKEKADRDQASAQLNLNTMIENARNKFQLSGDGFDKMIERMKETGNYSDAEAAAAWVVQQTPTPAAPGPYLGPQNLNLYTRKDVGEAIELLSRDPDGAFLDHHFTELMKDPAKYCADAGFPYQ